MCCNDIYTIYLAVLISPEMLYSHYFYKIKVAKPMPQELTSFGTK
jgi:hypothetical protein